jgi:23S rRNA pseudouridine2605 synthase
MTLQRLHKVMASSGIASRRECEELIAEGRVTVDGEKVRAMGVKVDAEVQDIRFDGERIQTEVPVYYVIHKPKSALCTSRDDNGRRTVISLIKDPRNRRIFTVGRLDEDSEGLILVTNDGAFANQITHPRYGIEKTYELKLRGSLTDQELDRARRGIWLSSGKTDPMCVKIIKRSKHFTNVICKISEGRNRQLRRVFARLGHNVQRLTRTRIGSLKLTGLKRGASRLLTRQEVTALLADCQPGGKGDHPVGWTKKPVGAPAESKQRQSRPRQSTTRNRPTRSKTNSRPTRNSRPSRPARPSGRGRRRSAR